MRNTAKTYFKVMQIVDMIMGILFCITIAGLIFGIPLIIAAKKFEQGAQMKEKWLIENRGGLFCWGIFSAIVLLGTIVGFVIVLALAMMVNSYIKDLESGDVEKANRSLGTAVKEGASNVWNGTKEALNIKPKLDKEAEQLAKVKKMFDDGIITEEEYNAKRKAILKI